MTLKPNIFLFVIDSFQGDKCHSKNKTSKTPNIDWLIENGVYFSETFCSSSTTGSSTGSIFTGLFPFKTGMGGETYRRLSSKSILYTKLLKKHGYNTNAILPSNEIVTMGLPFGFDENYETYSYTTHLFDGLGEQILGKILSEKTKEPWFIYVHILDLHSPINPPKKFDSDKFGMSKYERMVSAIDVWIGKILNKLNLVNTLFILTSDHGEYIPVIQIDDKKISFETGSTHKKIWELGSKIPQHLFPYAARLNFFLQTKNRKSKFEKLGSKLSAYQKRTLLTLRATPHHRVYDELLHVPLILMGYGVPSKGVISGFVRNVDIFPTIWEILGLKLPETEIHGRSIFPLINNENLKELPLYIESPPSIEKSSEHVTGIRTSRYKYFRSTKNPEKNRFLYDLKKDPLEETNVADSNPKVIKEMEHLLTELLEDSIITNEEEMSKEEKKKIENELKKMGYI